MTIKLGLDCDLYYQTTGTRETWPATGAAPNLTEITNVKDVSIAVSKAEHDATTRAANGWEVIKTGLKSGQVEFQMLEDPDDAILTAIVTAFYANTTMAFAILNGDSATAGTRGLWADFEIVKCDEGQPIGDLATYDIAIKPAHSSVAPERVLVAAA